MKMKHIHILAFASLFSILSGNAFGSEKNADGASVERYALYIGSNVGGNNKRLLYAGTDATSFQNTMAEIGGIRKANSILLLDPAKDDVDNAMEYISTLINRNKENARRSEFVFYYSGHSDENALLLGKNTYDYSSLKASISKVPSDVHVVILDSCYSGNFIRTKGGQKQKPFLVDDSSVIKGHAYLSSSSSQEFSQESDEIGSSFFTNAMITGLRGAADSSGDKKVTLNELYSYAFNETLSKTENSSVGPQHPNYNITLVGSGDLVLSDISESDCILTLAKELSGRVIIRDKNEKLVSEINKTNAGPIYLAMEAGQYGVTVISETATLQGNFELGKKKNHVLAAGNLSPVIRKTNALRGDGSSEIASAENATEADEDVVFEPVDFTLFGSDYSGEEKIKLMTNLSFGLVRAGTYRTYGLMLSIIGNQSSVVNGAQISYIYNMVQEINGAQITSVFNRAGTVHGAQLSGCVNVADTVKYCQGAGLVNVSREDLKGAQGAGIFNYAGSIEGAQGAGVFNYAGSIDGVQGAGVGNYCNGNIDGVQGAGIFNIAKGNVDGVQGSGIFNITDGSVDGVQGAGVFNIAAGSVDGVQGASILNYAGYVDGLQIGLVNICSGDVDGLQFGLINFCKNGIFEFGVSYTTENEMRFSLTSGSKKLHSVIGYMADFKTLNKENVTAHIFYGLGKRFEFGIVNFDFELIGNEIISVDETKEEDEEKINSDFYPSARLAFGINPAKHVQIFAGAMISYECKKNSNAFAGRKNNIVIDTSDPNVKFHPEFELGLKFCL